MKRFFRYLRKLYFRWRYTGSFRRPGCRLTLQELEELAKLFPNKSNPNKSNQ
jgi:hypothetical protein